MTARVLVVEDNPDNMKLVLWILEDEGYECDTAMTAEAAFDLIAQRDYDIVLMDISLPGMSGEDATRILRKNPKHAMLPIVAVTAHAIKGEEESIMASGVTELVTKPIDEEKLTEVMRRLLMEVA